MALESYDQQVGTYTGDGTSNRAIATTFPLNSPDPVTGYANHAAVMIFGWDAGGTLDYACFRHNGSAMTGTSICGSTTLQTTKGIMSFTANGFTVTDGTIVGVHFANRNGQKYTFVAMRDNTHDNRYLRVGTYNGLSSGGFNMNVTHANSLVTGTGFLSDYDGLLVTDATGSYVFTYGSATTGGIMFAGQQPIGATFGAFSGRVTSGQTTVTALNGSPIPLITIPGTGWDYAGFGTYSITADTVTGTVNPTDPTKTGYQGPTGGTTFIYRITNPVPPPANYGYQGATGLTAVTYTTGDRWIISGSAAIYGTPTTGLPPPPSCVWIWGGDGVYRSLDFVGNSSTQMAFLTPTQSITNMIKDQQLQLIGTLDPRGFQYAPAFQLGTGNEGNQAGHVYHYVTLTVDSGSVAQSAFRTFTGVGTASPTNVTLNFTPGLVCAKHHTSGAAGMLWRGADQTTTKSTYMSAVGDVTTGITAIAGSTITLGATVAPNGEPFYGFAFAATASIVPLTYDVAVSGANLSATPSFSAERGQGTAIVVPSDTNSSRWKLHRFDLKARREDEG